MPVLTFPSRQRTAARLRFVLPMALTSGLAACGSDGQTGGAIHTHMELYCQTAHCVCVEDSLMPFAIADKREPDWRLTGEPFCPDGFHLETADDD